MDSYVNLLVNSDVGGEIDVEDVLLEEGAVAEDEVALGLPEDLDAEQGLDDGAFGLGVVVGEERGDGDAGDEGLLHDYGHFEFEVQQREDFGVASEIEEESLLAVRHRFLESDHRYNNQIVNPSSRLISLLSSPFLSRNPFKRCLGCPG